MQTFYSEKTYILTPCLSNKWLEKFCLCQQMFKPKFYNNLRQNQNTFYGNLNGSNSTRLTWYKTNISFVFQCWLSSVLSLWYCLGKVTRDLKLYVCTSIFYYFVNKRVCWIKNTILFTIYLLELHWRNWVSLKLSKVILIMIAFPK